MSKFDDFRGVLLNAQVEAVCERYAARVDAIRADMAQSKDVSDGALAAAFGTGHEGPRAQAKEADGELAKIFAEAVARKDAAGAPSTVAAAQRKVAVVPFMGYVNYSLSFFPYAVSTKEFAGTIANLNADKAISAIAVIFDSGGGDVVGLQEAADALYSVNKPTTAIIDPYAASAAYYVASQAGEISILPSGSAGSIGVRSAHVNIGPALEKAGVQIRQYAAGKYKLEGNPFEAPSAGTEQYWTGEIAAVYQQFLAAVARGRSTSIADVSANYGQGRVLRATDARRAGMVDRLETPGTSLARAQAGKVMTRAQAEIERLRAQI